MTITISSGDRGYWLNALSVAQEQLSVSYDWIEAQRQINSGTITDNLANLLTPFHSIAKLNGPICSSIVSRHVCDYVLLEGIHYPVGGNLKGPSPSEVRFSSCKDECIGNTSSAPQYARVAHSHRLANQRVATPQFSGCFLERLLQLSRTAGREIAVDFDARSQTVSVRLGEAGRMGSGYRDVSQTYSILHTHPRATEESLSVTTHHAPDLMAPIIFANYNKLETVSTTIGSVCGEAIDISIVAVSGSKIYVMNEFERNFIKFSIQKVMDDIQPVLQSVGVKELSVEVNPGRVQQIAASLSLTEETEAHLISSLERLLSLKQ